MPTFSIVIPTRNRARYLRHSLAAALEQTFGDYEVLVSDNHSDDETAAVVRETGNPRLRYVRTPRPLSMPDSWEFAVRQAAGEWVTVLSDDDSICNRLLTTLQHCLGETKAELVAWKRHSYFYPDWYESEWANSLVVSPVTGRFEVHRSETVLRRWYETVAYMREAPMLLNACCRRSLIEHIQAKTGRFFIGPAPDVGASAALLTAVDRYVFIDDALALAGNGRVSIGAASSRSRGEPTQKFAAEFGASGVRTGPVSALCVTSAIAGTLLTAKELLGSALRAYELDWVAYFRGISRELHTYGSRGVDTTGDWAAWTHALGEQSMTTRLAVSRAVAIDEIRRWTGRRRADLRLRARLRRLLGRPPSRDAVWESSEVVVRGAERGFSNILECTRRLEEIVPREPG